MFQAHPTSDKPISLLAIRNALKELFPDLPLDVNSSNTYQACALMGKNVSAHYAAFLLKKTKRFYGMEIIYYYDDPNNWEILLDVDNRKKEFESLIINHMGGAEAYRIKTKIAKLIFQLGMEPVFFGQLRTVLNDDLSSVTLTLDTKRNREDELDKGKLVIRLCNQMIKTQNNQEVCIPIDKFYKLCNALVLFN